MHRLVRKSNRQVKECGSRNPEVTIAGATVQRGDAFRLAPNATARRIAPGGLVFGGTRFVRGNLCDACGCISLTFQCSLYSQCVSPFRFTDSTPHIPHRASCRNW
jgi:hypothetical protein